MPSSVSLSSRSTNKLHACWTYSGSESDSSSSSPLLPLCVRRSMSVRLDVKNVQLQLVFSTSCCCCCSLLEEGPGRARVRDALVIDSLLLKLALRSAHGFMPNLTMP